MDPQTVNAFLDAFIAAGDRGFGLIAGEVGYVLNALIVISIVLAGAQWALAQEAPIAAFFRKVLYVGLFAFLVNNWNAIATAINRSGAMLGLRAGGDGLTLADLHNPGRMAEIGGDLFARTMELAQGLNLLTDALVMATIFLSALAVLLAFYVLALQVFIALIAFKLGALAAFVALPWGVFSGTSWVAERPLGWVAGSAMRLFVLALIASIAVGFVATLPQAFALEDGGVLNVLLFGLTILALSWFGPQLASEVMHGQPHLAGADVVGAAMGATALGAGAIYAGASGARGAAALASAGRRALTRARVAPRAAAPASASIDHGKFQPGRKRP